MLKVINSTNRPFMVLKTTWRVFQRLDIDLGLQPMVQVLKLHSLHVKLYCLVSLNITIVTVLITDLSKAFDTANRLTLLMKMEFYGVRREKWTIIKSPDCSVIRGSE